jgi:hypothetical protein
MGLQLRLTHPLGSGLVDVDARPADRPIVVGRGATADVQVPSSTVGKSHCVLFVHNGHWAVRDGGTPLGTFLNGRRVTAPEFVGSGDVITLGAEPGAPTLTVDPHNIGVTEETDAPPAPVAAPRAAAAPAPPPAGAAAFAPAAFISSPGMHGGPSIPPPAAYPTTPQGLYAVRPPGYPAAPVAPAPPSEDDEWAQVAGQALRRRTPKPKKDTSALTTVGWVLCALVAIAGVYAVYASYQRYKRESERPTVIHAPAAAAPAATAPKAASIFDENADAARQRDARAATQPAAAPAPAPAPRPAAPPLPKPTSEMTKPEMEGAPADIVTGDADWDAIEQARVSSNNSARQEESVTVIVKLYDYQERHADKNRKTVDAYLDEAADALWWKRLAQLFEERDAARTEISKRKAEIADSKDPAFKQMLEAEITKFAEKRDRADDTIRAQMKFAKDVAPNLFDSQERAALRTDRDPALFASWKEQVLRTVKSSRGQRLPWRGSR